MTATSTLLPATHSFPGFRATKTDTATIFHRVPIFAECERGDFTADAKWIQQAVKEAKLGERSGHLPPLHAQHHDPHGDPAVDAQVRSVGVFKILEAAPMTFKGRRVTAIYADLIVTDEYFADELARMRYPYRSVEIFNPDGPPKINGLALLDHEAPYLELPMLFANEVEDRTTGVASATIQLNYASDPTSLMLGSLRRGKREILLFRFDPDEVDTMATKTKDEKTKTDDQVDEVTGKAGEGAENFGDDEKKGESGDGDDENMEDGPKDVGSIVKMIESGEIPVKDLDAIIAAIQAQKGEADAEEPDETPAPAPAPGAEIMKDKNTAKLMARQEARIVALQARLDDRDNQDREKADVDAAMARLSGRPLGANLRDRLVAFHKKAKGDSELFKVFVDELAKSNGVPPEDGGATDFENHPNTPKAAMKFSALGHEAVDHASRLSREYDNIGRNMRASRESYIAINMRALGYELPDDEEK